MNCLKKYCRAVVEMFGEEWLRLPTPEECLRLEKEYRALGFPGCIGCVDCASWVWDCCSKAWEGQCRGKDNAPTVRMEVIFDDSLHIWCNFGSRVRAMTFKLCITRACLAGFVLESGHQHFQSLTSTASCSNGTTSLLTGLSSFPLLRPNAWPQ
jgi:Plant transposon protein